MKNKKFWSIFSISLAILTLGGVISAISIKTLDTSHTCEVGTNLAYSSTSHFYTCTNEYCANKFYEEEHDLEWVIDKEETFEENGIKHEECKTCNYKCNVGTVIDDIYNYNEATISVSPSMFTPTASMSAGTSLTYGTVDLRVTNGEPSIGSTVAEAKAYKNGSASGLIWNYKSGAWIKITQEIDLTKMYWNSPTDYSPLLEYYMPVNRLSLVKYKQSGQDTYSYLPYPESAIYQVYIDDIDGLHRIRLQTKVNESYYDSSAYGKSQILLSYSNTKDNNNKSIYANCSSKTTVYDGKGGTLTGDSCLQVDHSFAGTLDKPLSICIANNSLYIVNVQGEQYKILDNCIDQYLPSGKVIIQMAPANDIQPISAGATAKSWKGSDATLVSNIATSRELVITNYGGIDFTKAEQQVKVSDLDITVPTYSAVDYGTKVNVTAPTIKLNGVTLNTSKLVAKIGDSKLAFRGLSQVEYYFYEDSTIEYYYDGVKVCESTIKVKRA